MKGMLKGMSIVFRNILKPDVTVQYPDEIGKLSDVERGRLLFFEDRCIKCRQCERVCPNGTIDMEVSRDVKGETGEKLILDEYSVHHGACLVCGLCTETCPVDALAWVERFEKPTFHREDMWFDRERLRDELLSVHPDKISGSTHYDRESFVEDLDAMKEGEQ